MNAISRARAHSSIRTPLAALLAAVLLTALLPLSAAAQTSPNLGDPCRDATTAATQFADYDDVREAHRASLDCSFYRDIWPGTRTTPLGERFYEPLTLVTRAQIAQFIHNALVAAGYDDLLPAGKTDHFTDIAAATERLAVNRLAEAGIFKGTSATTFSPGDRVSRQQLATILVQAANWAMDPDIGSDGRYRFTDVPMSNVHKLNIENGADAFLFRGRTESTFRPGGIVRRDEMASFSINLLRYSFESAKAPLPFQAQATVQRTTVERGDQVTGTVKGSNLSSVTVQGCGVPSQVLTDSDPLTSGLQFALTMPTAAPLGGCDLQFTYRFANAVQNTAQIAMTVRSRDTDGSSTPRGRTPQPELISAKILEVDTSGSDMGTTVRYTFDEALDRGVTAAKLHLVASDGLTRYHGDSFVGTTATDGDSAVDVFFLAPVTQAAADLVTVATVDFGAVQDKDNAENPEGDAPIGSTSGGSTTLRAGVTLAPDVTKVDVQDDLSGTDEVYEVVFTFDETVATATTDMGDFALILENGTAIECKAVNATPDSVNVETECGTLGGPDWLPGDASRGIVFAGSVADSSPNSNVLQAAEAEGDDGNTPIPDLVSAKFYPGSTSSKPDQIGYTFDEPIKVDTTNCGRFFVYDHNLGAESATSCVRDSATVVLATFGPDSLDGAVGVYVEVGAVQEDSTNGEDNQPDEVGVATTTSTTGAGFTRGPDLTKVTMAQEKSVLGTVKGILVTYTFDEDVDALLTIGNFFVYDSKGDRYEATACLATDLGDEPTVECTGYKKGSTVLDLDAEKDLYASAAIGTVEQDAVEDDDGIGNHEAAAR